MIAASDLDVFVLAHSRPDLLQVQLQSLVAQTERPETITVLDNGVMPEMREAAARFSGQGVAYANTHAEGPQGNALTAQRLAGGKFVALFHDDDAVAPRYFETVIRVLNARADDAVNLVTCRYEPQDVGKFRFPDEPAHARGLLMTRDAFASFVLNCYSGFPFAFYRTAAFKRLDIREIWRKHGKWCDIPILLETVGEGRAAFLSHPFAIYGHHAGQDSADPANLPSVRAWANLEKVYVEALGSDLRTLPGWTGVIWNRRRLRTGYRRRGRKDMSFAEYCRYARQVGAVNRHGLLSWLLSRRLVQKAFTRVAQARFKSRETDLLVVPGFCPRAETAADVGGLRR